MTAIEAEQEIGKHLESGERLLWSGVPRQGFMLRKLDGVFIPFTIMVCGFTIVFATILFLSAPVVFVFFGIPFAAIGLYSLVGRFFFDAMSRTKKAYGFTNWRIIIISGIRSRTVKSLPLGTLSRITLEERRDGSGHSRSDLQTTLWQGLWVRVFG